MGLLTFCIHPFRIQVRQSSLIAKLLERFRGFGIDKTTATPSPDLFRIQGHLAWRSTRSAGSRVAGEAQAGGAVEKYG